MKIERASEKDIKGINKLLGQVLKVHHNGRSDIFKSEGAKYSDEKLIEIIKNDNTPVFVAKNEENEVLGHAFCIVQTHINHSVFKEVKTLYIDDICIEENSRGQRIGKSLYEFVLNYAKENEFYNITLNVWAFNESALKFYEDCGFKPQKIGMEFKLN